MREVWFEFREGVITPWNQRELNTIIGNALETNNGVPFICFVCHRGYVHILDEYEQPVIDNRIHVRCKFCKVTNDCVLMNEKTEREERFDGITNNSREFAKFLVPTEIQKTQLPDDFLEASAKDSALQELGELFDESQLVRDLSPRACCVLLRVAMEGLVEYILTREEIDYSRKSSLAAKIQNLHKHFMSRKKEPEFWDTLRGLGNEAAHLREELQGSTPQKAISLSKGFVLLIEQDIIPYAHKNNIIESHPPHSLAE